MKKPLPDINLVGASFAIKANFYTAKMYIIIGKYCISEFLQMFIITEITYNVQNNLFDTID